MGMTMSQKILAKKAGLDSVAPGQLINADVDMVLGNDITTPVAIDEFEKYGFDSVYSKTGISIVLDHFVPNKDIKAAQLSKRCREFAGKYGIEHFFDVGRMGIEHALLPEQGIVAPGELILADLADEKSCADYRSYGLRCWSARKGPGSRELGVRWLQGLNAIVIDPVKCPCVLQEFLEWEYEVAPDGTVLGTLMEANDHGIDAARYACSRIWQRKGA